jgi:hypothetical protein
MPGQRACPKNLDHVGQWLMTDAKKEAEILDQDACVPSRLIGHKSSGINHFRYGTGFGSRTRTR